MTNLASFIERNAAFTPDKVAIRFEGASITYAAFAQEIGRATHMLRTIHAVRAGDRVAVLASNGPGYLSLLYACARLGAILLPLNWRLAAPELRYILDHAEPRVAFVEPVFAETLREAAPGLPSAPLDFSEGEADGEGPGTLDDALLLVYTSGTTGRPKGALLAQEALFQNAVMSHHMHGMTAEDHVLAVLPFFHVGGLNIQTTPALQAGATVTIHPRFAADAVLAAIRKDRPSLTVLVPATIRALLAEPGWADADLSSLRAISTGSEPVHQAVVDAVMSRGVPLLQVYGATESCPIAIYTRLGGDLSRGTSTGLPGLLCEARVADDTGRECPNGMAGEVLLRGRNLFRGYWRDDAATRACMQDGWYRTGDIGTRDADGYFHVHDRRKNMIISGGENIYPAEVERVLLEHPAIAEAAVLGEPDPKWQEVPVAFLVLRAGMVVDDEGVRAHVSAHLARFKVPRRVVFTDSLPRTALGKVRHFELRPLIGTTA
ncbi:class I adenylate-forming enzyme family protein [Roseomonas xinghualingensis]|uniref:class I adenylate-forming enzyme family protein n=1 Tax=Roseomonas xinghualingensis TaxID=2986475 RepID=UPI0021F213AA|nr:AMP-binding protein [Roseomonas sp. SXEYE001]MCV4208756.1 AMP-binding protein [Roseomonas sp. SXEYE001]